MNHNIPSQFKREQYLNLEGPSRRLSANTGEADLKARRVVADSRIGEGQKCSRLSSGIYDRGRDSLARDNVYFRERNEAGGLNGIYKDACGKANMSIQREKPVVADAYGKAKACVASGKVDIAHPRGIDGGNNAFGKAKAAGVCGKSAGAVGKAIIAAAYKPVTADIDLARGKAVIAHEKDMNDVAYGEAKASNSGDCRKAIDAAAREPVAASIVHPRNKTVKVNVSGNALDDEACGKADRLNMYGNTAGACRKAKARGIAEPALGGIAGGTTRDELFERGEPFTMVEEKSPFLVADSDLKDQDNIELKRKGCMRKSYIAQEIDGDLYADLVKKCKDLKEELKASNGKIVKLELEKEKARPRGLTAHDEARLNMLGFNSVSELITHFIALQDRVEFAESHSAYYRNSPPLSRVTSHTPLQVDKNYGQESPPMKDDKVSSIKAEKSDGFVSSVFVSEQLSPIAKDSCKDKVVAFSDKELGEKDSRKASESDENNVAYLGYIEQGCNVDNKSLNNVGRRPRTCYVCRKPGHIAKDCSKQRPRHSFEGKGSNVQVTGVAQLGAVHAEDIEDKPLFGKQASLDVTLDGFKVKAVIKSGAAFSLITPAMIGTILRSKEVHNIVGAKREFYAYRGLVGADGSSLKVISCVKIPIALGDSPTKVAIFFVVQGLQEDVVIGANVLQGDPVWVNALCCSLSKDRKEGKHVATLHNVALAPDTEESSGECQKEEKLKAHGNGRNDAESEYGISKKIVAAVGSTRVCNNEPATLNRRNGVMPKKTKAKEDVHQQAQENDSKSHHAINAARDRTSHSKHDQHSNNIYAGRTWYNTEFYARVRQTLSNSSRGLERIGRDRISNGGESSSSVRDPNSRSRARDTSPGLFRGTSLSMKEDEVTEPHRRVQRQRKKFRGHDMNH